MEKYDLLSIGCAPGFVLITSTDPETLSWLLLEAQKIAPQLSCERLSYFPIRFDSKVPYTYQLRKLDNREGDLYWWILALLCHAGWEPFNSSEGTFQLRKKTTE